MLCRAKLLATVGLIALVLSIGASGTAFAQETATEPFVVGTKIAPPFVIEDEAGKLTGVSIELWERLAADLDIDYVYKRTDLKGLFQGLEDGSLDIAVAALGMTAKRERVIDFTHPFYTSGLAVAVQPQAGGVWGALKRFLSYQFFMAVLGLLALLLLVGFFVWLAERRANAEEFGGSAVRGLGNGLWWAAVTMTTVGYGDKSPRTLAGRIVGLVWMFAAIILISGFTAAIATSLTVGQLDNQVENVDDLRNVRVASVADSTASESLYARGISFSPVEDEETALTELAAGRVDAVVQDAPILRYLANNEYPRATTVLAFRFDRQEYAFALPPGQPLRERLNRRILQIVNSAEWSRVRSAYLSGIE